MAKEPRGKWPVLMEELKLTPGDWYSVPKDVAYSIVQRLRTLGAEVRIDDTFRSSNKAMTYRYKVSVRWPAPVTDDDHKQLGLGLDARIEAAIAAEALMTQKHTAANLSLIALGNDLREARQLVNDLVIERDFTAAEQQAALDNRELTMIGFLWEPLIKPVQEHPGEWFHIIELEPEGIYPDNLLRQKGVEVLREPGKTDRQDLYVRWPLSESS